MPVLFYLYFNFFFLTFFYFSFNIYISSLGGVCMLFSDIVVFDISDFCSGRKVVFAEVVQHFEVGSFSFYAFVYNDDGSLKCCRKFKRLGNAKNFLWRNL